MNGAYSYVSVNKEKGISSNEQLAYLRTLDIKDFMMAHVGPFMAADMQMGIRDRDMEAKTVMNWPIH